MFTLEVAVEPFLKPSAYNLKHVRISNIWFLVNKYYLHISEMVSVENFIKDTLWWFIDDILNVVNWLFLEILSDVQLLTWNFNLHTSSAIEI